ncbi:SHOCT domain-containing protein [Niveibacterium terrae]|uniref:SHOCT domain-containing protein n=1 Tax=Niveibacterium terrae TaxID=3373598 RepID=UPI003A8D59BD
MSLFRLLVALALVCAALGAQAAPSVAQWLSEPEKPLRWGDWDRVMLKATDHGAAPANDHPVRLDARDIAERLTRIRALHEQKLLPVFSDDEIARLAPVIAEALAHARSDQDLLFLTSGKRSFFGDALANAGRIFFANGELNLIFGTVVSDALDYLTLADRRSPPVEYGSRTLPPRGVMLATPRPGEATLVKDNWIRLPIAATRLSPPVDQGEAVRPAVEAGARAIAKPPRNTAQRLEELGRLHSRGLIDDAEFAQKRRELESEP